MPVIDVAGALDLRVEGTSLPIDVLCAYLPGAQPATGTAGHTISVTAQAGREVRLERPGPDTVIYTAPAALLEQDLPHLLGAIAKQALLSVGCWVVHAAAVALNGKVWLLVGHAGAGKTSCVLAALAAGGQVAATDRAVLRPGEDGRVRVLAGTDTISVRRVDAGTLASGRAVDPDDRARWRIPLVRDVVVDAVAFVHAGRPARTRVVSMPSSLHRLAPLLWDPMGADCVLGDGRAMWVTEIPPATKVQGVARLARVLDDGLRVVEVDGQATEIVEALHEDLGGDLRPGTRALLQPAAVADPTAHGRPRAGGVCS